MPSFDCFLSHNSQDKPAVRALKLALEAQGLRCWLDEEQLQPESAMYSQRSARSLRAFGRLTMIGISPSRSRSVRRWRPACFASSADQGVAGPPSNPSWMSCRRCSSLTARRRSCSSIRRKASRTTSLADV